MKSARNNFLIKPFHQLYNRLTKRDDALSVYLTPLFASRMRALDIDRLEHFTSKGYDAPDNLRYGSVLRKLVLRKNGKIDAYLGTFPHSMSVPELTKELTALFDSMELRQAEESLKWQGERKEWAANRESWNAMRTQAGSKV